MNNQMPSYEELLSINHDLGEKISDQKEKIQEMGYEIDELFRAATLYRELYFELLFKKEK